MNSRLPKSERCKHCRKDFVATDRAYLRRTPKFCSPSCWYAWRREHEAFKTCKQCDQRFKGRSGKFCSPRCLLLSRGSIRICQECGKEYQRPISRRVKYCSWACHAKHLGKRNIPKPCLECGELFKRPSPFFTQRAKFCSQECGRKYLRGHRSPMWRGLRSGERGITWGARKKTVHRRDGVICQACGAEAQGQRLDVDHLIPYRYIIQLNKRSGSNHDPNSLHNLISLCRPCHSAKTSLEVHLFRGDVYHFWASVGLFFGSNYEPLRQAFDVYGMLPLLAKESA